MSAAQKLIRLLQQLGWPRTLATLAMLALALIVPLNSWTLPLAENVEQLLYDMRHFVAVPHVDADPRIVMVVYNDETLRNTEKRSPLDRTTLAKTLTALNTMGAKAIGIDILIDQPQTEDPQLVAAFRAMTTPTYLAFATNKTNPQNIEYWQEQFLRGFQSKIATPFVHPASVLFEADSDASMRRWPPQYDSLPPLLAPAMTQGNHLAFKHYQGAIGYRLPLAGDRAVFTEIPIDLLANPNTAPLLASQINGRYVLIGGDIINEDRFDTPISNAFAHHKPLIGLEIHAHMLAQLLSDRARVPMTRWMLWTLAVLTVATGALTAFLDVRTTRLLGLLTTQIVFFGGLPFWLEYRGADTLNVPAFGWGLGWLLAFIGVGTAARSIGSEQRRFAQSALGKYLPRDIATEILANPEGLKLHGEKREIFALFSDLEGFTKLSHAVEPEVVATLLNRYLETLSNIVLEHGGTIDKFVGDAVVAFWGAPIARPDDGERAVYAAIAIHAAGEAFRNTAPKGVPPIGRTRVGVHYGEAIVGNFGGEGRIQYTALGDSMNTASRLEGANKQLRTSVLVSAEVVARSGLDWFRPLGRIVLRGRATPVDVFEPVPNMRGEVRNIFAALVNAAFKGEVQAREKLNDDLLMSPGDEVLANLVYRLHNAEADGSYVLR